MAGAAAVAALLALGLVPALRRLALGNLVRTRWTWALLAWILLLYRHVIFGGMNYLAVYPHWVGGYDPWGAALVVADQETLRTLTTQAGRIPLWDPAESAGKPIMGDPSYRLLDPLNWLSLLSSELLWLHFLLILKTLLSAVFMWKALSAWGVCRAACLVGCMLWTGNGYFQGYVDHNQADVFLFYPLAVYGVRKLQRAQVRRGTWAVAASVFMFLVGGNPQSGLIGLGILAACIAFATRDAADRPRFVFRAGVATVIGGLLAAPEVFAMVDYHRYWFSIRGPMLLRCSQGIELMVKSVLPDAGNSAQMWSDRIPMFSFVGVALVLAGLPALVRVHSRGIVSALFAVLVVNLYLLVENHLAPSMPLRTFLGGVLGLGEMHICKYVEGIHFILSFLAAFSLGALLASSRPDDPRASAMSRVAMVAPLLLLLILVLDAMYMWWPLYTVREPGVPILLPARGWSFHIPLLAILTGCLLLLLTTPRRGLRACALALILALAAHDMLLVQGRWRPPSYSRDYVTSRRPCPPGADPVVTRLLKETARRPGAVRVLDGDGSSFLRGGNPHGIHQVQGFNALLPRWYAGLLQAAIGGDIDLMVSHVDIPPARLPGLLASPWLPLLGVGYVVAGNRGAQIPPLKALRKIVESRQLSLYELATPPRSRVLLVHSATVVDSAERGIAETAATPELFARRALLVGRRGDTPGPLPGLHTDPCGAFEDERAEVVRHTPDSVEIRVRARAPGLLVITETYAPAWRATLDGREQRVWLANGAFRGVRVPAGEHRLTLTYAPCYLLLSVSLSILALGCLALLTIRPGPRRSPRSGG